MDTETRFTARGFLAVVLVISIGLVCAQGTTHAQTVSGDLRTELDKFFRDVVRTQQYVGLGACMLKNNSIAWEGYYGYANREAKTALTRGNIFSLMSLSKTVTAFALMTLLERGLCDLDDDINKYLTISVRNPNFPDTPITFRMLLNHTASLADVTSTGLRIPSNVSRPPSARGDSDIPLEEYIREILTPGGKYYSTEYFSQNMPGSQYSYSNIGYSLIGYLVQEIARQDFAEYCRERIFKPLELNNTGWHLRDLDTSRVIFGYSFSPNDTVPVYRKVQHFGEPGYPCGMLRTTMDEFARFIGVIMDNGRYGDRSVLNPATVELMLRPQGMQNIPSRQSKIIDKSLAWLILDVDGSKVFSMNGFSGSMFTNAYFSPSERSCIIYYITGLNMKNMAAVPEITKRLFHAVQSVN
jgi:CubicO group peptidase (beta-lactamase class C family)